MKDRANFRADSLASLSETRQVADPRHKSEHPQPDSRRPLKPVYWVVVKRYGGNMQLQGREEFTHPDFDRMLELATAYVKRMAANPFICPFTHFDIEIIRSRE